MSLWPHNASRGINAFTLIELLVVVTIIVVLLALLVPAMDKAIYHAELTACGANLKGIATSATTYAAGSKRYYPHRPANTAHGLLPGTIAYQGADDRPILMEYLSLDMLLDPLCGEVDLAVEASSPDAWVLSNYNLWFGIKYQIPGAGAGMFRIGDRLGFNTDRFRVLASDDDINGPATPGVVNSHPDKDGTLRQQVLQSRAEGGFGGGNAALELVPGNGTWSRWLSSTTNIRGLVDRNMAFTDGSVARYENVLAETEDANHDPRMTPLPAYLKGQNPSWMAFLPAE